MNMAIKYSDKLKSNWLTVFTVIIFVSLLVFFALCSKLGVSPDGLDHLNFAIKGIPRINILGPATQDFPVKYVHFYTTGYGYHYLIHLVYRALEILSANSINEFYWFMPPFLRGWELEVPAAKANMLVIIRAISVIFTCLQAYMLKKICDILGLEKIYPFVLLWLSFSLMFPFLHGNASRDVLINLLSVSLVYHVLAFHKFRRLKNLKFILLIIAVAPFVQLSLCAFVATVLVSYAILCFKPFIEMCREIFHIVIFKRGYLFPFLLGIVAFPSTADIANKIIQYKSIKPGCKQIFSYDECRRKNPTFKVYSYLKVAKAKKKRIDLFDYFKVWYPGIFKRIFGIMGHKSYIQPNSLNYLFIIAISIFFFVGAIFAIRYDHRGVLLLGLISLIFSFILFYFVNRKIYLFTGMLNAALQGRYIFPIYPLMVVFAHSFFSYLHRIAYYFYTVLLSGTLFYVYYLFFGSSQVKSIVMTWW